MALGQKLRRAREAMRLTPSEVAMRTRMKVQTVEELEKEDFSRIAAPIYGKGFIKLYAECVGLDPRPLIEEYVGLCVDVPPPSLARRSDPAPAVTPTPTPGGGAVEPDGSSDAEQDLFTRAAQRPAGSRAKAEGADGMRAFNEWNVRMKRERQERLEREAQGGDDLEAAGDESSDSAPVHRGRFHLPHGRHYTRYLVAVAFALLVVAILILSIFGRNGGGEAEPGAAGSGTAPAAPKTPGQLDLAAEPPAPYIE